MAAPWDGPVADEVADRRVRSSEVVFHGKVWDVRRDEVDLGDGQTVVRDVLQHPGAVGVLALDDDERVLLVRQYRHPTGRMLWEAPAGLLDVEGERPLAAAQRELVEEAGYRAQRWHVLVDYYNSPGGTTEAFRCYLARGLEAVAEDERHEGEGEERDMPAAWVPLDEAVDLVLAGALHNPTTVSGVLAAAAARSRGWSGLRPADAPWPERFPEG
ncbi:NUDIX domain-containing protein [Vallicoccus soli]|uniref:NUDIX hydrolase n=1 Tax=Vallicoccus soli TaxID=2339232 RepID=A0A3A3YPH7_9ACTN|nr:NUDIX hydrolase [Vallicoccus soli]RJK93120.1 NUDIX hydrolase [Vallicoccus soli]